MDAIEPAVDAIEPPAPHLPAGPHRLTHRTARSGYRWLTALSWPRRYPLVQFPNAPLILAFLGGQVAGRVHGTPHDDALAISFLAMTVWGYEELVHGVNRFRNLLGLVYVISTAAHLAAAISR
jgi:hypothetical protein